MPYLYYSITVLLKLLTWHWLDIITPHFNLAGCPLLRLCVHRHGMTEFVCAPSHIFSHIHYLNSDLRCNFLICGYVIFMSLHCNISYLRNMSMYNLCIYFTFPLVSMIWRFVLYHLSLSQRFILSCLILSLCWTRLFLFLPPCWTQFLIGLT